MRPSLPWLMVLVLAVVLLALGFGILAGLIVGRVFTNSPPSNRPLIADTATVVQQIQSLNQFVTVKYVLEKVVVVEDAKWFGGSRLIMVAHGIAKAGFDLKRIQSGDIAASGDRLSIRLPKPQITDLYLDDRRTEILERSTGLLRTFEKDLEQDARRQALDKIKVGAVDSGILKDAEERARHQFAELGARLGFKNVEVSFR